MRITTYAPLLALVVGCHHLPAPPVRLADDTAFSDPIENVPAGLGEQAADAFRLAPGDKITIRTFAAQNQEHTHLLVDEQGRVHVPLAGDVAVAGMTLVDAERGIESALAQYERAVRVHVVVESEAGHSATVLGAVRTPGRFAIAPNMRLTDLLALAGGPMQGGGIGSSTSDAASLADLSTAMFVRDGAALPISFELAQRGDVRHNIRVRSGDHLYIPNSRGRTIAVIGEVRTPQLVVWSRGVRLSQALAMAGGFSTDGHRKDIRVVRGELSAPRVYQTSLRALVDGNGPDVELAPGDIVYVTRTGVANLREALTAISPLLYVTQSTGLAVGLFYGGRASSR